MPSLTLSIPKELKEKMSSFPEINWSEIARQAIWEKTRILERMNKLLSKSKLTHEDTIEFSKSIKNNVLKKHALKY